MRIIAGCYRSRRITAPPGRIVRPTGDRARETLFAILGDLVPGSSFLDLFAGSGAVGLEAASRGATRVVFVERDPRVAGILSGNIEALGAGGRCRLMRADWEAACRRLSRGGETFDLIFADPPYSSGLAESCLRSDEADAILRPGGVLIIEHDRHRPLPDPPGRLALQRTRVVGEASFSIYTKEVRL